MMNASAIIGIIFQLGIIALLFIGVENTDNGHLLQLNNSNVIRSICCIVVVLSHIGLPLAYSGLGYLHFIAVSFFFLLSGYGLTYSVINKPEYLSRFYKRILKLLFPYVMALALRKILKCGMNSGGIFYINVLLVFYIIFFIAFEFGGKYNYLILIIGVLIYSIVAQQFHDLIMQDVTGIMSCFGWGNQSLAFLYGVFIAKKYDSVCGFFDRRRVPVLLFFSTLTVIFGLFYLSERTVLNVTWSAYFVRVGLIFSLLTLILCSINHIQFNNKLFVYGGGYLILCFPVARTDY